MRLLITARPDEIISVRDAQFTGSLSEQMRSTIVEAETGEGTLYTKVKNGIIMPYLEVEL